MAGRLSHVASRIMGGNGVVSRSASSSLRLRSGMGLPVGKHIVPNKPLSVNDELIWDNGMIVLQIQSGRHQRCIHMITYEWSLVESHKHLVAIECRKCFHVSSPELSRM